MIRRPEAELGIVGKRDTRPGCLRLRGCSLRFAGRTRASVPTWAALFTSQRFQYICGRGITLPRNHETGGSILLAPMANDQEKEAAARASLQFVKDGEVVGLGTG